jgi:hypothetical protein
MRTNAPPRTSPAASMADVAAPRALDLVDAVLREAVAAVADTDPNPLDPFRGLYITDDAALLSAQELDGAALVAVLAGLEQVLGFDPIDMALLALCAAPELDPRYGRLVAYLQDDVTRRRPSPRLLARLLGGPGSPAGPLLARLAADAPLRRSGAVRLAGGDPLVPVAERPLVVDELLVAHLVGAGLETAALPEGVRDVVPSAVAPGRAEVRARLARLLDGTSPGAIACVGPDAEQVVAHAAGSRLVAIAANRLTDDESLARARMRATLSGALLVVDDLAGLEPDAHAQFAAALAALDTPRCVIGPRDAHVALVASVALHAVEVPELTADERLALWSAHLPAAAAGEVAERFLLSATQIADAATVARARAREHGRPEVGAADTLAACRAVSRRSLDDLATRLTARWRWDDLVLPDRDLEALRSIVGFVRHRDRVLGEWGFGSLDGRAGGLVALFSGESGTGKTMAAQVIANDLGLEAYRIDLAGVVSKYIGETERNLDRVFHVAEHANAVLVFDEADALFGKRSAVSDARDRYANLEVAYLLQRVETYPGVVILTTNLRQDVDQAFLRRIDQAIDFPMPGPAERARLWRRNLPAGAPVAGDVDLDRLAGAHPLPGGAIRNCARAAAFAAAGDGASVITAEHIERAVALELRKLGRLSVGSS